MARAVSLDRARLLAVDHNNEIRRISYATSAVARREFRKLDPDELDRSWFERVGPQVQATVELGQLRAAELADDYVSEVTGEAGSLSIDPRAFSGLAADGRDLDTLLRTPVVATKSGLKRRLSSPQAFAIGERAAGLIAATETTDAGRVADGVAITVRPELEGYVRLVTPPSCGRCAILAGRFYRWSSGFERHPNCDCTHIPARNAHSASHNLTDPMAVFRSGGIRGLSKADHDAIRDGADIGQVINAHRGMYEAAGRKMTREGTSKQGFAYTRRGRKPRMRPEAIYKEAGSREEAINWLRDFGYIV